MNIPPPVKTAVKKLLWPLLPSWPDEGRRLVQGAQLKLLLERAARESNSFRRVFNAGAGEGGYSPLLLSLPGVASLFESDFSYGDYKPTRIDSKQAFFGASLTSLPLADATVDLILCTEVLEHIVEHEQALSELQRVLAPNGWLLITVPTPPAVFDAAHVREGYRPEELSAMLAQRGFATVETRFCMYVFFRFLLSYWPRLRWRPRVLVRGLAVLDQFFPIGPPMDLMILARKVWDAPVQMPAKHLQTAGMARDGQ